MDRVSVPSHNPNMVNVVIPAWNEQKVLPACLASVLGQDYPGPMRLIVIANGCKDATAAVARSVVDAARRRGIEMIVIELACANKPAALNAGDAVCIPGIRVYLDADIQLSSNAIAVMVHCLSGPAASMSCPQALIAPSRAWLIRRYARMLQNLTYFQAGTFGCGVYAVNAAGRRRWSEFPDLLAEDSFVRNHFSEVERRLAAGSSFTLRLQDDWRDLVRVAGRWIRGRAELARKYPELARQERAFHPEVLMTFVRTPSLLLDLPFFLFIHALAVLSSAGRRTGAAKWDSAVR
jgi:glycosyltransferase involved in cell wall biosynthesis